MQHIFLYTSLLSLHDYDVKIPINYKFYGGRKNKLLKKSTPGKFAYICHFQRIGINATKFKKREFILKVSFSLPLPSSMLKLPFKEVSNSQDTQSRPAPSDQCFLKNTCSQWPLRIHDPVMFHIIV